MAAMSRDELLGALERAPWNLKHDRAPDFAAKPQPPGQHVAAKPQPPRRRWYVVAQPQPPHRSPRRRPHVKMTSKERRRMKAKAKAAKLASDSRWHHVEVPPHRRRNFRRERANAMRDALAPVPPIHEAPMSQDESDEAPVHEAQDESDEEYEKALTDPYMNRTDESYSAESHRVTVKTGSDANQKSDQDGSLGMSSSCTP